MGTYRHTEDIDINYVLDIERLDNSLRTVVNRTANIFVGTNSDDLRFGNLIADILQTFLSTHRSIRVLVEIASQDKDRNMGMGTDANSLTREQVEKVFLLSLLLEDQRKWVRAYLRSDWRKQFEDFLLAKEEHQDLPRYKEFLTVQAPQQLEMLRLELGVTDEEKEAAEFKFYNPQLKERLWPTRLQGKLVDRFPMPSKTKTLVGNSLKQVLERWHLEYDLLCGYTHIGIRKLAAQSLRQRQLTSEQIEKYFVNKMESAEIISFVATLSACTEVYRNASASADVIGALTELWTELEKGSLLGKVFWNIQAKSVLGVLV